MRGSVSRKSELKCHDESRSGSIRRCGRCDVSYFDSRLEARRVTWATDEARQKANNEAYEAWLATDAKAVFDESLKKFRATGAPSVVICEEKRRFSRQQAKGSEAFGLKRNHCSACRGTAVRLGWNAHYLTVDWPYMPREGEGLDVTADLAMTVDSVGYDLDGHNPTVFVGHVMLDDIQMAELRRRGWRSTTIFDRDQA